MEKLSQDLPSVGLPCVCLRFYTLYNYHSFRLLYGTQNQQQPGCCSSWYAGGHSREFFAVANSFSIYTGKLYPVRRVSSILICELYVLTLEWFPEMNEVQEMSMTAAFRNQLSYICSALHYTLIPPLQRMYGSVRNLLKCFLYRTADRQS